MYFNTNNEMKKTWPKNEEGEYLELKDTIDLIIGEELNTKLSKYYDGWDMGCGKYAGEQSWFFVDVPDELMTEISTVFNTVNPSFLEMIYNPE